MPEPEYTLNIALTNDNRDSRNIELILSEPVPWDDDHKLNELIFKAEQLANDNNPPHGWPVGVPCGEWTAIAHLPLSTRL